MKKITINVKISDNAELLLNEIKNSDEPDNYSFNTDSEEMYELDEQGLIESIMGEQFYLSRLGEQYLNSISEHK